MGVDFGALNTCITFSMEYNYFFVIIFILFMIAGALLIILG